jgi:protein ImuA
MSAVPTSRVSPSLLGPKEGSGRAATIDPKLRASLLSDAASRSSIPPLGAQESWLRLGVPALDAALEGGLSFAAMHELAPVGELQLGAAFGFALAIAGLAANKGGGRQVLCIATDFAGHEGANPYGVGCELFALPMRQLLMLRVAHAREALWAFEEGLKCASLAAVLAELPEAGEAADFTATRRLMLAAQTGGGLGLLLRHKPYSLPSAAMTRWQIAPAASRPDRFGGLGAASFDLSLTRNRRGRCGRFIAEWNHHERIFAPQALSLGLAATAGDRPDRARLPRTA